MYLNKIYFIHMDVNGNCRDLTIGEEKSRLSSICTKTERKIPLRLPLDACLALSWLLFLFSRFNSQTLLLYLIVVLVQVLLIYFLVLVPILRPSYYGIFYGIMFGMLTFVSSDFLMYACYLEVCSVQIIPAITLPIILNLSMYFSFISEKDRPWCWAICHH